MNTPDPSIYTLKLSPRVENALIRAGVETVNRLKWMQDTELLNVRGIGVKAIKEIREKIPKGVRVEMTIADHHGKNEMTLDELRDRMAREQSAPVKHIKMSMDAYFIFKSQPDNRIVEKASGEITMGGIDKGVPLIIDNDLEVGAWEVHDTNGNVFLRGNIVQAIRKNALDVSLKMA